ncbi:hypothetical protein Q3W71_01050 [Micromonospora sp. C28SCA-DRY-2]|uniref:hypothetical protein n=1 Tax=Micromonospora sp. C28SCA-DRY-2 TaxID=3059522 RepID=UPI0026744264|nr:hypothetical protein [Micromonospora sp. C28SCA-DRY-2]MDO3700268.1 hypothetical protein [Micromonospora sp. C28SCA-DRY-2]
MRAGDPEVAHQPPEEPDAVLATTTDALLAAFGDDDLAGLVAAGAAITGAPEVVRQLVANVRVPAATWSASSEGSAVAVTRPALSHARAEEQRAWS